MPIKHTTASIFLSPHLLQAQLSHNPGSSPLEQKHAEPGHQPNPFPDDQCDAGSCVGKEREWCEEPCCCSGRRGQTGDAMTLMEKDSRAERTSN